MRVIITFVLVNLLLATAGCSSLTASQRVSNISHLKAHTQKSMNLQKKKQDESREEEKEYETRFAISHACSLQKSIYDKIPYHFWPDEPVNLSVSKRVELDHLQEAYLSPGDLIDIYIHDGDGFNGNYVLDSKGAIKMPFMHSIVVAGLTLEQTEDKIAISLAKAQLFQASTLQISVRILKLAPVEVNVVGAVYQPGRVLINNLLPEQTHESTERAFGDHSEKRTITEALRAASGIRPDAKLDKVLLIRNDWHLELDFSGVFTGEFVQDIPLIAGDQIVVPTTGCFQPELVRPSQITPKGFRVFMSNLIEPAQNNAAAAVGRYSSNVPYGTRLLQAAISANCVGGTQAVNAGRSVALVSQNPVSGVTEVVERSIEEMMRNAHRDEINPHLLPNDAIACYDSDATNIRSVVNVITDVLRPFTLL